MWKTISADIGGGEVLVLRYLLYSLGAFVYIFFAVQFRSFLGSLISQEEWKFNDNLKFKLIISALVSAVIFILLLLLR